MNNKSFKRKYTVVLFVYTILILILWFAYHSMITAYTKKNINNTLELESQHLITSVEEKLSSMKASASLIGASSYVKDFFIEADTTAYYEKAATVHEIISKATSMETPFDGVITINTKGEYYRFIGSMSNKEIENIYKNYSPQSPFFTSVNVEGKEYFCYIYPVYDGDNIEAEKIGDIVIINSLTKTRRLFSDSNRENMETAIVSGDQILICTQENLEGKGVSTIEKNYPVIHTAAIENTNLAVVVAITSSVFDTTSRMFQLVAIFVAVLFLIILGMLGRYLSHVIINPLITTKEDIKMGLLGTQMDAHFVVNTLHTIEILLQKKETGSAEKVTYGLTEILKHQHSGMSNVFAEMAILEHYIEIMNIRYHQKFIVEMDVNEELVEYVMQSFLVQPIIENAFTHGFSRKNTDCVVKLEGILKDKSIFLKISDNGIGITKEELSELQKKIEIANISEFPEQGLHKVALVNIQKRIQTKHGTNYGISINSVLGVGTTVTLYLPAIRE